jgi:hypothetical protein
MTQLIRKEAFEGLELCEGKLSCTVLRGLDGSNPVRLLGHLSAIRRASADAMLQTDFIAISESNALDT